MIAQLWIAVFGLTASFMVYCRSERVRRWAPVLALIAQPAWYLSAIGAQQWGVVVLTVFYTGLHARGLWMLWIKPKTAVPVYAFANDNDTGVYVCGDFHADKDVPDYCEGCTRPKSEHVTLPLPQDLPWQEREMEREFGSRH